MKLLFLTFFYVSNSKLDKIPIKAIRKEGAFITPTVPRAVALAMFRDKKKTIGKTKPTKKYWKGVGLKRLPMFTYPNINDQQWFTYIRTGEGKVKRLTLYQYMKRRSHGNNSKG